MSQVSSNSTPTSTDWKFYTLRYKKGGLIQQAMFRESAIEKAITLGKKYCEANALHFVHVDPAEVNLQELLDKKAELAKEG